ncbi:MAG: secretion protein HlyD, partial [Verrucomicrobia bacterium]|nr:secretion protein HlyD [Verrucomicrobiota bacterium]
LSKVSLENAYIQFSYYERLVDKKAVSEQIYQQSHYAYLQAIENVKVAEENVRLAESNIDRSIIRAPIGGKILQVNIHEGEIAPVLPVANNQSNWMTLAQGSLILMGTVDPLQVRIDIDEEDCWRYQEGSPARAFVRGNSRINFPIHFLRLEPYMIPKSSFTGETTERVDTRVLQVLYNFEKGSLPVYPGQVLDIFIESTQKASQ